MKRRKVSEREMEGKEKHQTKTVDKKGNESTSKPREDSTLNPPPSSNGNTLTLHAALPCFFDAATTGFGENGLPSAHRGLLSLVGIFVGLFPVTRYTFILLCYHCWHTCWIFSCHTIRLYIIMLLLTAPLLDFFPVARYTFILLSLMVSVRFFPYHTMHHNPILLSLSASLLDFFSSHNTPLSHYAISVGVSVGFFPVKRFTFIYVSYHCWCGCLIFPPVK